MENCVTNKVIIIINFINLMALTSFVSFFFLKDLFTGLVIFCFLL